MASEVNATATKQNRDPIRHSLPAEVPLRLVIDTIPIIVWSTLPDGSADYVNQRWVEYTGLPLERGTGSSWTETVHPDDVARMTETWRTALSTGEAFEAEVRRRRADGEYRWFLERAVPFRDDRGNIARWYGTSIDIEDRKHGKDVLRRNEAYLAEAQRLSRTGSWAWDVRRHENIYWSAETYRLFGVDPESGSSACARALDRFHADDVPRFEEAWERAVRERSEFELEYRVIVPEGIRYVRSVGHPVVDSAGNVVEFYGAAMDITEPHETKEALQKALAEITVLKDQLHRENLALKAEIEQGSMFEGIIGSSDALRRVLMQVVKVAPTDATVLITGETGTGKGRFARAIHNRSSRSGRPLIRVNCTAIPPALIATELFGRSGEMAESPGTEPHSARFQLAKGGTIFLDEIGELSAEAQGILLRVLQDSEGDGPEGPAWMDVRVLASTTRDLRAAVDAGTFRQELFYRLNVFPIHIPPLRQRKEDIPPLVEYLTQRFANRFGKRITSIDKRTLHRFETYPWPGNVRELQNVIERAVVLCEGEILSIDDAWLQPESLRPPELPAPGVLTLEDRERQAIEAVLTETRGRVAGADGAAAKLGVPRSTLESKIKALGIKKHRFKSE